MLSDFNGRVSWTSMFNNVQNILDNDSMQVCRLCLAEEEDLVSIFKPEGYQGFRLCEVVEELLQVEVSKKDGLPWTICEGCICKVKDFKIFKTTCIKSKITFLAMIANRGLEEPTNTLQERRSSETNRKDSEEVEVKEETPVVSTDEDPLQEVTVVRGEGHGGKIMLKDEVDENESISDAENFCQEIHWKDGSACTGVTNDAAFADPLAMIDVKEDAGAGESWSEAVTYNQNDLQENDNLDVGASNVVCLPIAMGELITLKDEIEKNESTSDAETYVQEIHWKDGSACTGVSNYAALADPLYMIDVKEDAGAGEPWSESVTYNENDLQENDNLDIGASNVVCLPIEMGELCGDKKENDSSDSLAVEEAQGVEDLAEDESRLTSVASAILVPPSVGNVVDGCIMTERIPKRCEEIVSDLIDDRNKNIMKKFEINTSNKRLPGQHSQRSLRSFTAKKEKISKSGDYITSALELSDVMPSELRHLDSHKIQLVGCSEFICDHCGDKYKDKHKLVVHIRGHISMNRPSTSVLLEDSSIKCFESRTTGIQIPNRFKCERCGKEFKLKNYLTRHLAIHRDLKKFTCENCEKVFWSKSDLLVHSKTHIDLKPFKCGTCGKEFKWKKDLCKHVVLHSGFRPFKCKTCGRGFTQKNDLAAHSVIHSGLKPFKCETCGKGFTYKSGLILHSVIHSGFKPFKCESCGQDFNRKSHLVAHWKIHSSLRPFKCNTCGKGFTRKPHLVAHWKTHSGLRPFKCDTCGKEFTRRSDLVTHSNIHSGYRPFKCDNCGKGFNRRSRLVTHLLRHSGLRPFKCDTCGRGFIQKSDLVTHLNIHNGLRPFKCDTCGMGFTRKPHLVAHSKIHSGLRPFKCDKCGKVFTRKYDLVTHSNIHSGLRPFKCDTCGKDFTRKSHLVAHSYIHSGLRPFKCDTCWKRFADKSSLVKHSVVHSGLRRFKCETCGKAFTQKSSLVSHLVIHSGLGSFKCDVCGKGYNKKSDLVAHSVVHSGLRSFKCETCGKEYKWWRDLQRHSILHS